MSSREKSGGGVGVGVGTGSGCFSVAGVSGISCDATILTSIDSAVTEPN